jgi:hypothetical protein
VRHGANERRRDQDGDVHRCGAGSESMRVTEQMSDAGIKMAMCHERRRDQDGDVPWAAVRGRPIREERENFNLSQSPINLPQSRPRHQSQDGDMLHADFQKKKFSYYFLFIITFSLCVFYFP